MLEHGYATVNGVRLHYVKDGKGKPVIFQHGYGQGWFQWARQIREFANDHTVVAFDLPGFNESDKPADPEKYKMRNLVSYITGLADHLEITKFTLVAHNVNGVGWVCAGFLPERIEKLVIINAPHPNVADREFRENPEQRKISYYVPIVESPDGEKFLSEDNYAFMREPFDQLKRDGKVTEEYYQDVMRVISIPGTLTAWCNYYRANRARGMDNIGEPAKPMRPMMISVPTLVIWGMKDHALGPGMLNGMEQYVPDLRVKRIADGTHQVVLEEPELVTRYIREFLAEK
jgi:pimeloyl-ACP methyl ester carboxylesterase